MASLTFINKTTGPEVVRIALYKKPVANPDLNTIAWKIVSPPPSGGSTLVTIPEYYEAFATYSLDATERQDPNAGNKTQVLKFGENTARFIIGSETSQDQRSTAATIVQTFDNLVLNEIIMENKFGTGVWSHITMDGDEVYPPQVLWPSAKRMEDTRSTYYVAVVAQFVNKGTRLVDAEISATETSVLEGDTITVQGSMWTGYQITTN